MEVNANNLIISLLNTNQTLLRTVLDMQVRMMGMLEGKKPEDYQKEFAVVLQRQAQATQEEFDKMFSAMVAQQLQQQQQMQQPTEEENLV